MSRRPASQKMPIWRQIVLSILAAILLYAVLFGYPTVRLYTDYLWFQELGQAAVYRTILSARLLLFFGFGLLFFLICYLNLWLAQRLNAARVRAPRMIDIERERFAGAARRVTGWVGLLGILFLSFLVGGNAATHWPDYVQFTHPGRFGQTDPVFGNDVGFYVFRLPFLSFIQSWFLFTLVLATLITAAVYYSERSIDFLAGAIPTVAPHVRKHLLTLLGFVAIFFAWGHMLARYELLFRDNGPFYGAGYTDLHARLPGITVQATLMLLTAGLCFANVRYGRAFRLPLVGLGMWAVASLLVVGVWPGVVQRFTVVPNQRKLEKPYIERDIQFTRQAYGLDRVKEQAFVGEAALDANALAANRATIDNIRLWDWPQLGAVYTIKQSFRNYYRFTLPAEASTTTGDFNIDVDRYRLGNEYRQVMLAARELNSDNLPPQARTWQNLRLQYTHGYGVVMSPVNRVDAEGLPEYFLREIPVEASYPELKIDRPQIYYGELTTDYVFVDTRLNEFDYPFGEENKETRYTGKGGVPLSGFVRRFAWSVLLGDANMLLSSDLTPQSRILYRRGIRERVQTLAPFLNWDNDPYLVVHEGRLLWIMDAYTATNRYPYSRPTYVGTGIEGVEQTFNYIRNAVKAVVDAYDGTVIFYVADKSDPIIQTFARIFPTLFIPLEKMPESLRAHVRYPEDLFRIQRDIFTTYHMSDPMVYYQKEDQWEVPLDPTPQTDSAGNPINVGPRPMMPYYVVMRLPGEAREEFLMMTPFTPQKKQNLSAWMCAKCDPDDYGQILVYRFPKGSNVNGPSQIMGQINAQEDISKTISLLDARGSKVIFGNLLVIPIESSLLYAVPFYVQATGAGASAIPQIRQVIVASGDRIVMRPTLESAIAALGEGRAVAQADAGQEASGVGASALSVRKEPSPLSPNPQRPSSVSELIRRANAAFERARQKQKEYDSALEELGGALRELQKSAGAKP